MGKRSDMIVGQIATSAPSNAGAGSQYLIQTPEGVLYWIYIVLNSNLHFKKSLDGGLSWTAQSAIRINSITHVSVWYDRWSGISAGLIHIAYTESGGSNDCFYRTIDTENSDALSTETVIFSGASSAISNSSISISRARGGNVYCRVCIDNGVEGGFFRLLNADVPNGSWASRTINESLAGLDMCILMPGFAADNQDMILIFWDASNNEISRQLYDDSANTWAETSISTGMVDVTAATAYPNFAATVDLDNSRIVLIAWNGVDTANADLLCWTVTESAITAKTDVVTNSTDDQGLCGITIDLQTGYWWAFYAGKSDGSETWTTSLNVYCKVSKDAGSTWSEETQLTAAANAMVGIYAVPRLYKGQPPVIWYNANTIRLTQINVDIGLPQANYQLGI